MDEFLTAHFWLAVGQITLIDILLGGDNAVVIALACRQLPAALRIKGILWGTAGAILLRVVLIAFALTLLQIPFLKLIGAALLLWVGIKMLAPSEDGDYLDQIPANDRLWAAVKTIILADLVMSIDNVVAIAGAADNAGGHHQIALVFLGLLVSIPIIIWGSQIVMKVMDRLPVIISLGGMLLGWIAATMAASDPVVLAYVPNTPWSNSGFGLAGALFVYWIGTWSKRRPSRNN